MFKFLYYLVKDMMRMFMFHLEWTSTTSGQDVTTDLWQILLILLVVKITPEPGLAKGMRKVPDQPRTSSFSGNGSVMRSNTGLLRRQGLVKELDQLMNSLIPGLLGIDIVILTNVSHHLLP